MEYWETKSSLKTTFPQTLLPKHYFTSDSSTSSHREWHMDIGDRDYGQSIMLHLFCSSSSLSSPAPVRAPLHRLHGEWWWSEFRWGVHVMGSPAVPSFYLWNHPFMACLDKNQDSESPQHHSRSSCCNAITGFDGLLFPSPSSCRGGGS